MTTFIIVAALMSALAAAAVAVPLLKDRQSRWVGIGAGVAVIGVAAALYPLWSNWNWHAPADAPTASPDVLAMVTKLQKHLQDDPQDTKGWLMLGRSEVALDKLDDAIVAYDRAHQLDAANPEADLGLGEAMSLRAGGNITPAASQLFEQAVALQPDNPKALLYGGFAAAERGDTATARSRWEALKALHPPPQIEQLLDARIAELGNPTGGPAGAATATRSVAAQGAGPAGVGPPAASAGDGTAASPGDAAVTVNISIAPSLKARLTQEAPLFVFAREPGGQGPPLAAKRLTTAAIGSQIHLSAADSMIPGRVLVKGSQVSITARVSFSGQPMLAKGDLYGEVLYDPGHDGARDLVIDRIAD
jgi:cytochrome c-type biogenesis protein CcmH